MKSSLTICLVAAVLVIHFAPGPPLARATISFIGSPQTEKISGNLNWQQKTFNLPAATQTLRWRYQKDVSVSDGQDRGWLDQVTFTPQ